MGMDSVRLSNVRAVYGSYKVTSDKNFIAFLDSMSDDEKEAYFYIEAQRSNEMIKSLSSAGNSPVEIKDLDPDDPALGNRLGFHFNREGLNSLINYWNMFGCLPKPSAELRENIIRKYGKYLRELTPEERKFFLEC